MPVNAVDLKYTLVAATDKLVLPKNPLRQYALLINDGSTDLYLGMGIPAAVNRGIRLNASGGNYEINHTNPWHGEIHAISAGTPDVIALEW